jgi:zinc protease
MPFRLAAVLAAFALAGAARADDATAALVRTAKGMFKDVRTETLPNGLRVYLLPVPGSPVVTTMVAYRVGSGDEEKDQTGLSHYLEHLLFKGTDKLNPGDVDRLTQRNGGANNAYTSEDMTVYHFDFAADRWATALDIEADRMRNTRIDPKHEFEQEKGAVIAELKRNEDGPWDLEFKAVLPMLFPAANPYSHPVIGQEAHVRGATAEIIRRHYDKWYHPNNASLVIVGGFDPADAMTRITKLFGPIPKGELPARKPAPLQPRAKAARAELDSKFDVPRLLVGFNTCPVGDPDDYVLDVIGDVLSSGKTCRLYTKLVDGERVANEIGASNNAGRYPGWFAVQVELLKGKDRAKVERSVFDELKRLAAEPVTDAELARVRRGILARYVFSKESVHGLANLIARTVTLTDLDYLNTYLDRVLAVTPADIQRVAAKYFREPAAAVVWSVPADEKKGAGAGTALPRVVGDRQRQDKPGGGAGTFSLKDAKRVVLPNGLTLVMLENHRLPVVAATAAVADVRLREPADKNGVAALVGDMLEEGTARHSGPEIATLIEDAGGSLSMSANGGTVKVLTPDTKLGLGLLFECLAEPTFPADMLEAKRAQLVATIADSETQPNYRAKQLFNATVYGDHPLGRPPYGKREVVEKLTADDCKAFHRKAFRPDYTIAVVVGDFDAGAMTKLVTELTANWPKGGEGKPNPPAPPPGKAGETIVTDPTAAQTHVFVGHLGVRRNDPDYYTLLVMDNVLGTGPGFTDRLSATLRDRQGLAYTVRATITDTAGEQPGAFTGYIGTFADKYVWVRDGFLREINRIRDEPPSLQEVDDAKQYLLGSLPFRLTTTSAVAAELLAAERYGLGFDVLEKYRAAVAGVTPAAVQAAARKHLDPKRIAVVAVGPIGTDGKPIPSKGDASKKDGGR